MSCSTRINKSSKWNVNQQAGNRPKNDDHVIFRIKLENPNELGYWKLNKKRLVSSRLPAKTQANLRFRDMQGKCMEIMSNSVLVI